MIKTKNLAGAQSVTANRLRDGAVVFLREDGGWSTDLADSAVARDAEAAKRLQAVGAQAAAAQIVVEPYLIEVSDASGKLIPITYRERIRAFGPSIPPPGAQPAPAA
jgi:hypothetical protein